MISFTSSPEQKARPLPVSTTQRSALSALRSAQAASIALVGAAVLGWAGLVLAHARTEPVSLWAHPGIELRQYATGLLILVGGIAWARVGLAGSRFVRAGSALAPLSYALYVIHRPVLQLAARFHATPSVLLDFVLWVLPATLALSYLLERKLQPAVNRALPG